MVCVINFTDVYFVFCVFSLIIVYFSAHFPFFFPPFSLDSPLPSLCNACFGVCPCGTPISNDGTCDNCGSLAPLSNVGPRRAPEHRRPRSHSEVGQRRQLQLERSEKVPAVAVGAPFRGTGPRIQWKSAKESNDESKNNAHVDKSKHDDNVAGGHVDSADPAGTVAGLVDGVKALGVSDHADTPTSTLDESDDDHVDEVDEPIAVEVCEFVRYRFKNSFTDDCYLWHVDADESSSSSASSDEADGQEGDKGEEAEDEEEEPLVYREDSDETLHFAGRRGGLYFCETDADNNTFVLVFGHMSGTRNCAGINVL